MSRIQRDDSRATDPRAHPPTRCFLLWFRSYKMKAIIIYQPRQKRRIQPVAAAWVRAERGQKKKQLLSLWSLKRSQQLCVSFMRLVILIVAHQKNTNKHTRQPVRKGGEASRVSADPKHWIMKFGSYHARPPLHVRWLLRHGKVQKRARSTQCTHGLSSEEGASDGGNKWFVR